MTESEPQHRCLGYARISTYGQTLDARLAARGIAADCFEGPASETAREIVKVLDPHGLHFAFLDPFNLGDLAFTALEQLANLNRMDM
jgi:hypothetical protein